MVALTEFYQKEGYLELLLTHHRDILESIEAHDPERAQKAMQVHLELVEEKMYEILEEKSL